MASTRIDLDGAGIRDLLASSDVQKDLDERAARVAQAVAAQGIQVSGVPGSITLSAEAISAGSSSRARAIIAINHPSALAVESKHRLLGAALDAAR